VWQNVGTSPVLASPRTNMTYLFTDTNAASYPYRYYRTLSQGLASTNVIGFVSVEVPPGYSLVANPLLAPTNTIEILFKDLPEGSAVYKYNSATGAYESGLTNASPASGTASSSPPMDE
jgi:hypothetical protein